MSPENPQMNGENNVCFIDLLKELDMSTMYMEVIILKLIIIVVGFPWAAF